MFWARVLKSVDSLDLKSSDRKVVRVRVSPRAQMKKSLAGFFVFLVSKVYFDIHLFAAEKFFGKLGSFVGRVGFATKNI